MRGGRGTVEERVGVGQGKGEEKQGDQGWGSDRGRGQERLGVRWEAQGDRGERESVSEGE